MILTETVNVLESMRFLVTARHTLADICRATKMENKKEAANYFINEASDYEIMHTLVMGELPEEKYNQESEIMMFGLLKQQLVENLDVIDEGFANKFIAEVNSLYPKYSTAKPVLEFQLMTEADSANLAKALSKRPPGDAAKIMAQEPAGPMGSGMSFMDKIRANLPSASTMAQKVSQFATSKGGQALGGAALAALLIYGGTKIYKRFFSQAAKACKGKSGGEKTACMKQAKANAIKKQISDIKSGAAVCAKSKNPEACKAGVAKKIAKLQAKMQKAAA